MWKNYIHSVTTGSNFKSPTKESEINQIKDKLNVELHNDLLELFNETNGVFDKHDCPLIWSTHQIVKDNLFFRNYEDYKDIYMPFDHLLFFLMRAMAICSFIRY